MYFESTRIRFLGTAAMALAMLVLVTGGCNSQIGFGFGSTPRTPTRPDGAGGSRGGDGSGAIADSDPCVDEGFPVDADLTAFCTALNNYRLRQGRTALLYSRRLEGVAQGYAVRLYGEDFFDHVAPDGSTPSQRAIEGGYCSGIVGENLAYGQNATRTADEAMQGLINSPEHNANMLNARWDYVGVGHVRVNGTNGEENWWVQLFGEAPAE